MSVLAGRTGGSAAVTPLRHARRPRRLGPRLSTRRFALAAPVAERLVSLAGLLVLLAVVAGAISALRAMPVEHIVVRGKLEYLREETLRDALAGKLSTGLLFLDLQTLRRRVEALPWVYRAQLRRRFPDTLEVLVFEQLPIARWGDAAFLNHEAVVIPVNEDPRWDDLPTIRGPQGSEGRLMKRYRRLREALAGVGLRPGALTEDAFGQVRVQLDNGVALHLGDRDFSHRVRRFLQLWHGELRHAARPVRRVDLRYESAAAVAFGAPAAPARPGADAELQAGPMGPGVDG